MANTMEKLHGVGFIAEVELIENERRTMWVFEDFEEARQFMESLIIEKSEDEASLLHQLEKTYNECSHQEREERFSCLRNSSYYRIIDYSSGQKFEVASLMDVFYKFNEQK